MKTTNEFKSCEDSTSRNLPTITGMRPVLPTALLMGLFTLMGCGGESSSIRTPTPAPTLTPAGGTYTTVQTVTISDTLSGAVLYCTTDGSTPSSSSPQCAEPTTVSKSETLSAIAIGAGYKPSTVASAAYTINLPAAATPVVSPDGGTFASGPVQVTISDATSGAVIYYTTDSTDPGSSSTRLEYVGSLAVASTETIKAIAKASNYSDSAVAFAAFTIGVQAPTPVIASTTGATSVTYPGSLSVSIIDGDANAVIYYAIGSAPTTSSTLYTGPIATSSPETIYAIAVDPAAGYSQSATASQAFTVIEATPTFSAAAGEVSYGSTVTLNDADTAATISYTTDGTDPASSPTAKTCAPGTAITIAASETVNARAVDASASYAQSAEATAAYTIPSTPSISGVTSATYSSTFTGLSATITAGSGATIYYTTDKSTPSATHGTQYAGAITVLQTETIQAIAIVNGASSTVASQLFTVMEATPTFSPASGSSIASGSGVTLSDADANATIYYTVTSGATGTQPTTSSTVYTSGASIAVSQEETIEAIAIDSSAGYTQSTAGSAVYYAAGAAPSPTFSTSGCSSSTNNTSSSYGNPLAVSICDSNSSTTIYYTVTGGTSGTTPTTGSTLYSGTAIPVNSTETIEAIAVLNSVSSAVASQTYSFQEAAPTFSIASGSRVFSGTKVTIGDADTNATIYYTTNGSPATTSSTQYNSTSPLVITANETLNAIAVDTSTATYYTASSDVPASYTLYTGNVISGNVMTGSTPISGATVALYAAGTGSYQAGSAVVPIAAGSSAITSNTVTTATDGSFAIGLSSCPAAPGDQLYLVATGGDAGGGDNTGIALMTALGKCSSLPTTTSGGSTYINATATINEVTTIASTFSLAGFAAVDSNGGIDVGAPTGGSTTCSATQVGSSSCNYPGIANAFNTVNNLANVTGSAESYTYSSDGTSGAYSDAPGAARSITPAYSNGAMPAYTVKGKTYSGSAYPVVENLNSSTVPQARMNTLANILAACVEASGNCATLFDNAESGSTPASDTLQAALNIARSPGANVGNLFALQTAEATPPYGSSSASTLLTAAPNDFTLALSFSGAGLGTPASSLDEGFSNDDFSIDANGNIFVAGDDSYTSPEGSLIAIFNNQGAPLTPPTTYDATSDTFTFGGFYDSSYDFLLDPAVLAMDESGNLWVGGQGNNRIGALAITTSSLSVPYGDTDLGGLPNSMAVDQSGNIWMGLKNTVEEATVTSGASSATVDGDTPSLGLVLAVNSVDFDPDGYLWAKTASKLDDLSGAASGVASTSVKGSYSSGSVLAAASEATTGGNGGVFACTQNGTSYNIYTTSGAGSHPFTTPGGKCSSDGAALDGENRLWILQSGSSGSPNYLDALGVSGSGTSTAFSLLSPSTGYTGTTSGDKTLLGDAFKMAVDGSGNLWMLSVDSSDGNNALVEFVGVAAPTVQPLSVAVENAAQGTAP